jgi:hypothetical protein
MVYRMVMHCFKIIVVMGTLVLTISQTSAAHSAHDCICPYDETIVTNPGTQSCGQIKCPACGHLMVRALYVGTKDKAKAAPLPVVQPPDAIVQSIPVAGTVLPPNPDSPITYTNTISGVVELSCSRCHGGPLRNLMTYENIKRYADSGLLVFMVRPGGLMNRFAEKNAQTIMDWAKNGAQR